MEIQNITSTITLNNGVKMPVLGLGVYKSREGREVIEAIHHAFEAGYRHIDTASFYNNEAGVGEAIRTSGVARKDVFVTSKVWITEQGYEETLKAFDASLEKLGFDYLDLYLIHWPVPQKYLESWRALEKLYREGKVKAIGLSNCLVHQIEEIQGIAEVQPAVLQNEFHPRLVQQQLINYCGQNQIAYEAWSPLMRGRILKDEIILALANKYQRTPAQIVIRWDLQKGVVTIPKSVHRERIFENAAVFDFELSKEDIETIDSLDREERTGAHPDNFLDHFE